MNSVAGCLFCGMPKKPYDFMNIRSFWDSLWSHIAQLSLLLNIVEGESQDVSETLSDDSWYETVGLIYIPSGITD
jgi:hypothetical protein